MIISRKILLSLILLIVASTGYITYSSIFNKPTRETGTKEGNILLDETFPNIKASGNITFSGYRNKVLVIDFMAPWCNPCKAQLEILKEIVQIKNVEIISINIDSSYNMGDLQDFAMNEGITWFFGHSPRAAIDYQITAIPTVIIADESGVIVYRGFYTSKQTFDTILFKVLK